ncbi:MAG: helix-turn-helix transcriptional regulator [Lachnospiraceae bacterium]
MEHNVEDTLGLTMKQARQKMEITQAQLAKRLNVSERYITLIENSHKKPKYHLLFKIIRELSIKPDSIFYPEKPSKDSQIEDIIRMLYRCDDHSLSIIRATVKAETEVEV